MQDLLNLSENLKQKILRIAENKARIHDSYVDFEAKIVYKNELNCEYLNICSGNEYFSHLIFISLLLNLIIQTISIIM